MSMMLVRKVILYEIVLISSLIGCTSSLDYVNVSSKEKAFIVEGRPVYADHFKVNSEKFPIYRLSVKKLSPPTSRLCTYGGCRDIRQIKIKEEDIWEVTHIVNDHYLIQSQEYNERQCRYLNKKGYGGWFVNILNMCLRSYDFSIYISHDGEITAGWELLPGPRKGGAERKVFFNLNPSKKAGWPDGIVFNKINKQLDSHSQLNNLLIYKNINRLK